MGKKREKEREKIDCGSNGCTELTYCVLTSLSAPPVDVAVKTLCWDLFCLKKKSERQRFDQKKKFLFPTVLMLKILCH